MDRKQKYVKIGEYSEIIIFPCTIDHDTFRHLNPISAGFCYIDPDEVRCFGKSFTLKLDSDPKNDSFYATKQLFGFEASLKL